MGETGQSKEYHRGGNNGWSEKEALVMDKLERIEKAIESRKQDIKELGIRLEMKIRELEERYHVAPCQAIIDVREDSGRQSERIKSLEQGQKETTRGIRWLIGIGLGIIGLLSGILYKGG